jgi:hypothetical protein
MLSAAALYDCCFVEISGGDIFEGTLPVEASRCLGYFFFEVQTGQCYWLDGNDDLEQKIHKVYMNDYLGSEWRLGRIFGMTAVGGSCLLWIWTLFLACAAHKKPFRYLLGLLLLSMTAFQGLTFLPLNSGFCDTWNCKFDRSAWFSIGAAVCFFLSALPCFCMKDYPGDLLDKEPTSLVAVTAALTDDEEQAEPSGAANGDDDPSLSGVDENRDDAPSLGEMVVDE